MNRFYLRGVTQVDKRTGEAHTKLPGRPAGWDQLAGPLRRDRAAAPARPVPRLGGDPRRSGWRDLAAEQPQAGLRGAPPRTPRTGPRAPGSPR